jgi:hypothetical protein
MHNLKDFSEIKNFEPNLDISRDDELQKSFSSSNDFEYLIKTKKEFEFLCLHYDPFAFTQSLDVQNLLQNFKLELPQNPYLSTKILLSLLHTLEDRIKLLGN